MYTIAIAKKRIAALAKTSFVVVLSPQVLQHAKLTTKA